MHLCKAAENGSNTLLRGADKDCPKISHYIMGKIVLCFFTLTVLAVSSSLAIFSSSILTRNRSVQSFPFLLFL